MQSKKTGRRFADFFFVLNYGVTKDHVAFLGVCGFSIGLMTAYIVFIASRLRGKFKQTA